jgi:hypothetical protein
MEQVRAMIAAIILFLLLAASARVALPVTLRFLREHRMTGRNYAGDEIPVGSGAVVAITLVLFYTAVCFLSGTAHLGYESVYPFLRGSIPGLLLVYAVGLLDDCVGERTVKGISGHWKRWRQTGTPSTGVVKTAGIVLAALWVAMFSSEFWAEALFDWITIALAANALNLLDVRPGRAWKSFYCGAAVIAAANPAAILYTWLLPGAAGGTALLAGDLKGKHMLGDSGANVLGFMLGCSLVDAAPFWLQAIAFALLAAMHRTAERGSISAWIERHKWVQWLDRFGRV